MKLYRLFRQLADQKEREKKKVDTKEESFMKFGREQFKTLAKKGLSVTVVLL